MSINDCLKVKLFAIEFTFNLTQGFRAQKLKLMPNGRNDAGVTYTYLLDEISHSPAILTLDDPAPLCPVIAQLAIPFIIKESFITIL